MISRSFRWFPLVLLLGGALGAPLSLKWSNVRLRTRAAELRERNAMVTRWQEENRRLTQLLAHAPATQGDGMRDELTRARHELAALEARARDQRSAVQTEQATKTAALETNRDPNTGLTRLEHFQNVGQMTPAAAFQTLAWAALKGDQALLLNTVTLDAAGRAKAETFIASLPAEAREKISTPEKLAALIMERALLEVKALQITSHAIVDPQRATITVLGLGPKEAKLSMARNASSWQFVVPEPLVTKFVRNWERKSATAGEDAARTPETK